MPEHAAVPAASPAVRRFGALLPVETNGPAETIELGRALARELRSGDLVALYGPLGAGKTHLIKGICAGLGIPEGEVTSPTFTLVNEYEGDESPVYHFDAYRIERLEEFYEIGYESYFYGGAVCLVEWPERVEPLLPPETLRLFLSHAGERTRRIVPG